MLHAGIHQNETVAFRIEWEVLVFQSLAVETDKTSALSEDRCELIHYAAFDTAVVMFGGLSDLGKGEFVDAVVEQVVECESESALKGSRRRKTGTQRNVTCEHRVEAFYLSATLGSLAADSENVGSPGLLRLVLFIETEFDEFVIVQ